MSNAFVLVMWIKISKREIMSGETKKGAEMWAG